MEIDHDKFFDKMRYTFGGTYTQSQVTNLNSLLAAGSKELPNIQSLAYVLATVWHETGKTLVPLSEYGHGAGKDYGKHLDMGGGPNKRVPYTSPDKLYYGRGYVQITWKENYKAMSKLTGKDLINSPELALEPDVACEIAIQGMLRGYFTGKSLKNYFPSKTGLHDPINARRIINGMDCAAAIAGYYNIFLNALAAHPEVA